MSRCATRNVSTQLNAREKKSICELRASYNLPCMGCMYHKVCDDRRIYERVQEKCYRNDT